MPSITSAEDSFVQSVIVAFLALAQSLDLYTGHLPQLQRSIFLIVYSTCGMANLLDGIPTRRGKLKTAVHGHFTPPPAEWLAAIHRGSLLKPRDP